MRSEPAEASGACAVNGEATTVDTSLGNCSTLIGDDMSRVCGNSAIAPSEECDDGNMTSSREFVLYASESVTFTVNACMARTSTCSEGVPQ